MDPKTDQAAAVRLTMQNLACTRAEFADLIGVTPGTVKLWRTGKKRPQQKKIRKVACKEQETLARLLSLVGYGADERMIARLRAYPARDMASDPVRETFTKLQCSRAFLGKILGVTTAVVHNWLTGKRSPGPDVLRLIWMIRNGRDQQAIDRLRQFEPIGLAAIEMLEGRPPGRPTRDASDF